MNIKSFLRYLIFFIITLFFIQPCFAYRSIEFNGVERRDMIREDTLRQEAKFGDYEIKIYRDWDIGTYGVVQIFQKGELVFEEQAHKFYLSEDYETRPDKWPEIGKDLTGDGEPNLVVRQWSGGAHCCYDTYIFSIGEEFHFIEKFEGEHSSGGFKDIDGDGSYEFIVNDWAFAYWKASFVGSPAPSVVFSFKKGAYQLNYDLMAKDPVNDSNYLHEVKENKELVDTLCTGKFDQAWIEGDQCITAFFWGHMLELIYTGHPDAAWAFMDRMWDAGQETKQAFKADFLGQLALSDYAEYLPVDFQEHKLDINDVSDKKYLRFRNYYNRVVSSIEKIEKEKNANIEVPTLDSVREGDVDRALRNWSGMK